MSSTSKSPISTPNKTISTRYTANPVFAAKTKKFLEDIKKTHLCDDFDSTGTADHKAIKTEIPKIPLISIKDLTQDPYCWNCHFPDASVPCSSCIRSFHPHCIRGVLPDNFACVECRQAPNESETFSKYVVFTLKNAIKNTNLKKLEILYCITEELYSDYVDKIIHPMDIKTLIKKNEERRYTNGKSLLSDVKWMVHNSVIYFGATDSTTAAAKKFHKLCETNLLDMEHCPQCFLKSNLEEPDWFISVCDKLHPIVMAKVRGYPYWPSKILSCDNNNAKCWFFGPHDKATVPINHLQLISKESLAATVGKKNHRLQNALDEMRSYAANYEATSGPLEYFPPNTCPSRAQLLALLALNSTSAASPLQIQTEPTIKIDPETSINIPECEESNHGYTEGNQSSSEDLGNSCDSSSESPSPSNKRPLENYSRKSPKKPCPMPMSKRKEEAMKLEKNLVVNLDQLTENELKMVANTSELLPPSLHSPLNSLLSVPHFKSEPNPSPVKTPQVENQRTVHIDPSIITPQMLTQQIIEQLLLPNEETHIISSDEISLDEEELPKETDLVEEYKRLKKLVSESKTKLEQEKQNHEKILHEVYTQKKKCILDLQKEFSSKTSEEIAKAKRDLEAQMSKKIEENKRQRRCSSCGQTAQFLCCWNTFYCSSKCQCSHWRSHFGFCTQLTQMITMTSAPKPTWKVAIPSLTSTKRPQSVAPSVK